MLTYVPFKARHIAAMNIQDEQEWVTELYGVDDFLALEGAHAFTLLQDGVPIVCCGAQEMSKVRASCWAVLSSTIGPKLFREVHALGKLFLNSLPYKRLEAVVSVDFEAGHRWVKAFGFKCEAPCMTAYELDGSDCALYARVRQ